MSCVLLNLVFLIGERRTKTMILGTSDGKTFSHFSDEFRPQAKVWQLSVADADRAVNSMSELLRLIDEGGYADGLITTSISYDDLDLAIQLSYKGKLPYIASEQRVPAGMIEEQIFAAGLSGFLSSVFADRINSEQKDDNCKISMYFQT